MGHLFPFLIPNLVLKKKGKGLVIENLFPDDEPLDSLVQDAAEPVPPLESTVEPAKPVSTRRLAPEVRMQKFDELYEIARRHVGKRPESKLPMRHSIWNRILDLASSEAQLEQVVGLFPGWAEGGQGFNDRVSDLFVRTCPHILSYLFPSDSLRQDAAKSSSALCWR